MQGKKVRFLRRIPVDPMTGKAEWGLRSMQDDPTSDSYGGQSVFDVLQNPRVRPWTAPSMRTGRAIMRTNRKNDAGFTLVELMIVMAIIGVLAVVAIPSYVGAVKQAREAVLKEDLHVMRSAIDSYTADKQKAPHPGRPGDGGLPQEHSGGSDDAGGGLVADLDQRCTSLARPDRPRYRRCSLQFTGTGLRRSAVLGLVSCTKE